VNNELNYTPLKERKTHKLITALITLVILSLGFAIYKVTSNLTTSFNPSSPHFSTIKPTIREIEIHTGSDIKPIAEERSAGSQYVFYPFDMYTSNGHYILHLRPSLGGRYTYEDSLIYDGKTVFSGTINRIIISSNGEHYAFTSVNKDQINNLTKPTNLYVDGKFILKNQNTLRIYALSDNGQEYFYTVQIPGKPLEKWGTTITQLYKSQKLSQEFNYSDAGGNDLLGSFKISPDGKFFSYALYGKPYFNNRSFNPQQDIRQALVFSDNGQHIMFTTFLQLYPEGNSEKLYIDNKYMFTGNIGEKDPEALINNDGKFALTDSNGLGGGNVYLKSLPFKIEGEADSVEYNKEQTHILIGYPTNPKLLQSAYFLKWQLDGKDITLPINSTYATVELANNDIFVYNVLK